MTQAYFKAISSLWPSAVLDLVFTESGSPCYIQIKIPFVGYIFYISIRSI